MQSFGIYKLSVLGLIGFFFFLVSVQIRSPEVPDLSDD